MKPELEQYFNNYFQLFRTEGWKQLVQELSDNAVQQNDVQTVKDNDDLFFRKGQLAIMASIIRFEETITLSHEQAVEDDAESI